MLLYLIKFNRAHMILIGTDPDRIFQVASLLQMGLDAPSNWDLYAGVHIVNHPKTIEALCILGTLKVGVIKDLGDAANLPSHR
jgi:hypothetical protein